MNNFDKSTIGVNLELNLKHDVNISSIYFDENFAKISDFNGSSLLNDRYCEVDIFLFTGDLIFVEVDFTDLNLYNINKVTKKYLINFMSENIPDFILDQNNLSKHYFDKYFTKLTKLELLKIIQNELSYQDIKEFLITNCYPKFNVFYVRGYYQGDYAEVIILDSILNEYNCKNYEEFYSKMFDYIHHLFYDAPIYSNFIIDDEEFYFDEYLKDNYIYNKSEFLKIAQDNIKHDKKEYIIKWLEQNLPDQAEY